MDEETTTSTAESARPALEKVISHSNLFPAYQLILSRKSVEESLGLTGSWQSFTVVHVDTRKQYQWPVWFTDSCCADKGVYLLKGWMPIAVDLSVKAGDVVSLERLSARTLALSHLVPPVLAPKTINQQQVQRSSVCMKPERDDLSRYLQQREAQVTEQVLSVRGPKTVHQEQEPQQMEAQVTEQVLPVRAPKTVHQEQELQQNEAQVTEQVFPVPMPKTANQEREQRSCICTTSQSTQRDDLSLILEQGEARVTEQALGRIYLQSRGLPVTYADFFDTPERQ